MLTANNEEIVMEVNASVWVNKSEYQQAYSQCCSHEDEIDTELELRVRAAIEEVLEDYFACDVGVGKELI